LHSSYSSVKCGGGVVAELLNRGVHR
jgi:hypothetical protein